MKKDFFDESFEEFLRKNADQLRMRPSENVWNNIEKNRGRHRRRITIGSTFLLLIASLLGYLSLNDGPAVTLKPVADRSLTNKPDNRQTVSGNDLPANPAPPEPSASTITRKPSSGSPAHSLYIAHLAPSVQEQQQTVATMKETSEAPEFVIQPVDEHEPLATATDPIAPEKSAQTESLPEYPLSIESVVNSYQRGTKKKKSELQFFFTPTISYRKLSENKSYLRTAPPGSNNTIATLYDVNNVVTHKPDLGLELGFALKYPVTRSVKVKTGLQFNMNRYDIKVFDNQLEIATIALNTSNGRANSLNTITRYRNFGGPKSDWIQNTYFQISSPVGVEVILRGDEQKQFGVATNIQPTYILGDRAYLISTDYKNYSQVPWLIRNWNVNTSVEAFVAYSTGNLKWQVGPQVRYQLLSSFRSEYPVKENLFDFGFKVGVTRNK